MVNKEKEVEINLDKLESVIIKAYKIKRLYLKDIKKLGNSEIFNNSNTNWKIYIKYFGNYNKKKRK